MKKKRIAYLRISTAEQRPDRQIEGLRAVADELHIEVASGATLRRPIYRAAVDSLSAGDVLVVWDLDRAYRSVVDALSEIEKLKARGIDLHIVNLNIDLSTAAGMFVYTIMGALAEFERRTLSQRTREGLQAARRRGKTLGRPRKLTDCQVRAARRRIEQHKTPISIVARQLGVSGWTLSRNLRRLREHR